MIANWMLYVVMVGALVSLGALAMEAALRAFHLPQRWVWAAALVLGLAIPAAARWMPRAAEPVAATPAAPATDVPAALPGMVAAAADAGGRLDLAALDGALRIGWFGSGLTALLALGLASLVLARRRRGWRAAEVDGVPVLLSAGTGPAVVGLFRSRIVLPAWVADADPAERALLLEHEREHLRAGDPRLLALGLMAIVLAPWNPAAWYGLRRLRLAIEIDCDARVLARRADVRAYGSLLLEVGRRASSGGRWITAAAFSEPASFLERRIRVMTSPRARRPLLRAAGFGAAALGLTVAACEAPGPAHPMRPVASKTSTAPGTPEFTPREAIDRFYPELKQDVGDSATVVLVFSPRGRLVDRRMTVAGQLRGDEPLPGSAANPADLTMADFAAGEVGPQPVRVLTLRQLTSEESARLANVQTDTVITTTVPTKRRAARAPSAAAAQPWDQAPEPVNPEQVARALQAAYPPRLRAAGIAATVQVRLRVGTTGEVLRVTAESASHPEAGPAAVRALTRMRFRPARKNGEPIAVEIVLPVKFDPPVGAP
ncbi:MAG TPA: M56 family metallopeptidase [Longimicrobium sp.]|nr:M56 family metallopeptidase [Longimicrobium sp.]